LAGTYFLVSPVISGERPSSVGGNVFFGLSGERPFLSTGGNGLFLSS
jgi:hypothetical protein